ncbi:RadC family protein [Aureispira anguillae]|uniref:DNA repair protein RadC n=1 Tax=Aureispira anguillae TaxID=2864201 RepID=A0A915YKF4_9BACT|nr:DNA repair protein RadC [Aureispira anguillae]BDS14855.1 DNA repair protein RadC [Aureispira anguillae]
MHYSNTTKLSSIKSWAEEDRPREKMLQRGRKHLSNAELIAILIGSGSATESAVGLAQRILNSSKNNLQELGKKSIQELQLFKGVGPAKAVSIAAALELGIRRQATPIVQKPQITQSSDAYNILVADLMDLPHEEFIVLLLNQSNRVMKRIYISVGGVAGTVVDVKKIFRAVLENPLVSAIILGHNHPSDNLHPSKADIDITQKIKQAGKYLDIAVLDHLIIAGNSYTSLADEGLM